MNLVVLVHTPKDAARFAAILCQRAAVREAIRRPNPEFISSAAQALDVYQEMSGTDRRSSDRGFLEPWFSAPSG